MDKLFLPFLLLLLYKRYYLWNNLIYIMAARSTKARVHALNGSFSIVRFGGEKKSSGCWKIHGTIVENRSRRDRPIAAMAEMEVVHPYSRFAKEHRILFLSCSILSIDSTIPDCIDKRSISNSSPTSCRG